MGSSKGDAPSDSKELLIMSYFTRKGNFNLLGFRESGLLGGWQFLRIFRRVLGVCTFDINNFQFRKEGFL